MKPILVVNLYELMGLYVLTDIQTVTKFTREGFYWIDVSANGYEKYDLSGCNQITRHYKDRTLHVRTCMFIIRNTCVKSLIQNFIFCTRTV
jgi:hypothetical protein